MNKISATKLSKELNISLTQLQSILSSEKLIYRKDNSWELTSAGKEYGGEVKFSKRFGEFIVWPSGFNPQELTSNNRTKLINATKIGESLKVSSQRVNRVLSELGWIDKGIKGWTVTKVGRSLGGVEYDHQSGGTYVLWPDKIFLNETLKKSFNISEDIGNDINDENNVYKSDSYNLRDKWPSDYRTKDGHRVRSRGEMAIDDYLYECGIVHAYEREVKNIEERVLCDFFIPAKNGGESVYIEYWGKEDLDYDLRKSVKQEIYRRNELNLIELDNSHIFSLDDHLPRMLLKFKIRTD